MTKKHIKKIWNEAINDAVVICPICGKRLKKHRFNSKSKYGWTIKEYDNCERVICMNCSWDNLD